VSDNFEKEGFDFLGAALFLAAVVAAVVGAGIIVAVGSMK
jgi:hypothetical protein